MPYPETLTTSDWVDALVGLSREEQIAALATWHRRVTYEAQVQALANLSHPDEAQHAVVVETAQAAVAALPVPVDYQAS